MNIMKLPVSLEYYRISGELIEQGHALLSELCKVDETAEHDPDSRSIRSEQVLEAEVVDAASVHEAVSMGVQDGRGRR